ncbi:MAG: aminotransferase class I/II-fold pyridoxal phosphate-dependent enzyme, partial [Pseudomonadota bacterium]
MQPSHRSELRPFHAIDFLQEANRLERAGRDIVHMEAGQPGAPAPERVRAAAKAFVEQGRAPYTDGLGLPDLRAKIAGLYGERYDLDLDPGRIAVTLGSSGAFIATFVTAFDQGARLGVTEPCYPAYPNLAKSLGLEAVLLPGAPQSGFQPTPDLLEEAGPLDGLLIASPANPTGAVMPRAALKAICEGRRDADCVLISDEIYHGVNFIGRDDTALAFNPDAFVVNSFSKYFAMPGWRIGWVVAPERFMRPLETLLQNLFIAPHTVSQHAAIAAFEERAYFDDLVLRYKTNRDVLMKAISEVGLKAAAEPGGAF